MRHQRKQHHRTSGKRRLTWFLTQEEPHPKRRQDHLQERDQARLGCRDPARSRNEENEPDAELSDPEQDQEPNILRSDMSGLGDW